MENTTNTKALIFGLNESYDRELEANEVAETYRYDVSRFFESFSPNLVSKALIQVYEENYKNIAILLDDKEYRRYSEGIKRAVQGMFEDVIFLRSGAEKDLVGYRESFSDEQEREGLKACVNSFNLTTLIVLYLEIEFHKTQDPQIQKIMNDLVNIASKNSKYGKTFAKMYGVIAEASNLPKSQAIQALNSSLKQHIDFCVSKSKSPAQCRQLLDSFVKTSFKENITGIQLYVKDLKAGNTKLDDSTESHPVETGPEKSDWTKYLSAPAPDGNGFCNVYIAPVNLPFKGAAQELTKLNQGASQGKYVLVLAGNLKESFSGNIQSGMLLTGVQQIQLYSTFFNMKFNGTRVGCFDFTDDSDGKGSNFLTEFQTLANRWDKPVKLHIPRTLVNFIPWLGTIQFYDSRSQIVVDSEVVSSSWPQTSLAQPSIKILEEIIKDVDSSDAQRTKTIGLDFKISEAEKVLANKNKVADISKVPESAWSEGEKIGIHRSEDKKSYTQDHAEDDKTKKSQEEWINKYINKEPQNTGVDEALAKQLKEAVEYYGTTKSRWVAKLGAVLYTNWKNQKVYKTKSIDDKTSLDVLKLLIREEDVELAKAVVQEMGGEIFLELGKQIQKIANEVQKNTEEQEQNAENAKKEFDSLSEDAKLVARIGTHLRFKEFEAYFNN